MLVIQPAADGRLHVYNNHRSDYARDEAAARALAYNWGHTDISINKALAEMRAEAGGEEPGGGWRVGRPKARARVAAPPARERVREAPPRVEAPAPVAERNGGGPAKPARARSRKATPRATPPAAADATPAPGVDTPPPEPESKAKAKPRRAAAAPPAAAPVPERPARPTRKPRGAAKSSSAPEPESPKPEAPAPRTRKTKPAARARPPVEEPAQPPRERALSLFRAGVKELATLEGEALPFARAPWSDLREMAEYITACLDGKRPKTGWSREGK